MKPTTEFNVQIISPRRNHAACWFGNKMLVYGGIGAEKPMEVDGKMLSTKNYLNDV